MRVKINYTEGGTVSKFVAFDTESTIQEVLDGVGQVVRNGGLYSLFDQNGDLTISLTGSSIDTIEVIR